MQETAERSPKAVQAGNTWLCSPVTVCVQTANPGFAMEGSAKNSPKTHEIEKCLVHGRPVAPPRSVTDVDDWITELVQCFLILSLIFGYVSLLLDKEMSKTNTSLFLL